MYHDTSLDSTSLLSSYDTPMPKLKAIFVLDIYFKDNTGDSCFI